mmetsp:Transcript_9394/g.19194  ORF Transcript_9394/g.19194 Transcript_9394/m.19194 type:complete len:206 (+) Transcript_9394:1683-2300(+)
MVGILLGRVLKVMVGTELGDSLTLGALEGPELTDIDGLELELSLGLFDRIIVGWDVGIDDGKAVGIAVVGVSVTCTDGESLYATVGVLVGRLVVRMNVGDGHSTLQLQGQLKINWLTSDCSHPAKRKKLQSRPANDEQVAPNREYFASSWHVGSHPGKHALGSESAACSTRLALISSGNKDVVCKATVAFVLLLAVASSWWLSSC